MSALVRWLRTPAGLQVVLGTVVVVPAVTLVFLGVRLMDQDRDLARQRRAEILQDATNRAVRSLESQLQEVLVNLADPGWRATSPAQGSVLVEITKAELRVNPPGRLVYLPITTHLPELPVEPFEEAEQLELKQHRLDAALRVTKDLARSSRRDIQAGALIRQARILRKLGQAAAALSTYDRLATFTEFALNGLPLDLQARKTRCTVLAELSRTELLREEALAIAADIETNRWPLDATNYEYVSALVDGWVGRQRTPRPGDNLSAAANWLYRQWNTGARDAFPNTGLRAYGDADAVTVVWRASPDKLVLFAAEPAYAERAWISVANRAAALGRVSLLPAVDSHPEARSRIADNIRRTAADTGLPWTVELSFAATDGLIQLDGRRRLLLSALAAIIVLVAVGTALIARARHSEMVLARLQSDFVTAVSHEFRTPLTALRQFNELLDDPELASPQQRRNYQRAQTRATQRLHRLVESLLDFGRMQAGKRPYTWQLVDARSLVSDVVDEFRGELGDCEIVVRANDLDEWLVRADSDALARALWNLLDNAVKYSGDGRTIFVTVERVANWISISVRDNGIGIPQDEQSRIFQKFTRGAAAQARRIRGTGIGLAMVQHIVSAHGGVISLQSVEGEGSTFTMRIHGIAPRLATDNSTEPQPVRDVRTSSTGLP